MSLPSCNAVFCLEALKKMTKDLRIIIVSAEIRTKYMSSVQI